MKNFTEWNLNLMAMCLCDAYSFKVYSTVLITDQSPVLTGYRVIISLQKFNFSFLLEHKLVFSLFLRLPSNELLDVPFAHWIEPIMLKVLLQKLQKQIYQLVTDTVLKTQMIFS